MRKIIFGIRSIPFALLGFCLAAFGILIPTLGFYWDDWPMVWFAHYSGPWSFPAVFANDRPFLSIIYVLSTMLLKLVPWQWQMFAVITRWLAAWAFWWTLKQLWPQQIRQVTWMALLFVIYPGFKQMPISVVYGNGLILVISYIASYGLMMKAIRNPQKALGFTIAGVITYAFCTISTEYYYGLDLLRGVFIWLILSESIPNLKKRALQTVKLWLPYLIVLGGFLMWRIFIFEFPTYKPELIGEVTTTPWLAMIELVNRIFQDVFKSGWLAWTETFSFPKLDDFNQTSTTLSWVVTIPAIFAAWFYLDRLKIGETSDLIHSNPKKQTSQLHWSTTAIFTGLIAMVVAGWPYWITNLPIELRFPYDRFTLAFMVGSCIFMVGLIEYALRTDRQKMVIMSLLIGMSIGAHLLNANTYRREWEVQKELFWQLTWRIPGLKQGTLLATEDLPLQYYSDNSLTAPLNWIYAPENDTDSLPYYLAFMDVRVGNSIPALKKELPIVQGYRNVTFEGNTSNALVFFYSPPGCLRILDPKKDQHLPIYPEKFYEAMSISNLDQIILNPEMPARPPQEIFGKEPEPSWCYYFEKADLARQQKDWEEIVRLGDQAFGKFVPAAPSEIIVFIEGYAQTGDWSRAIDLTNLAYDGSRSLQNSLCLTLKDLKLKTQPDSETEKNINTTLSKMECPNP